MTQSKEAIAKRDKRKKEIEVWIQFFCKQYSTQFNEKITIKPNIAGYINVTYWETLEEKVEPFLEDHCDNHKADRHKIISILQLCIMHFMPIAHTDKDIETEINARLAYFVGVNLISNWNSDKILKLHEDSNFIREHITWLKYARTLEGFPIFSNATTWYLYEQLCFREKNK